jgi:ankyrin repeat protein
LHLAVKKNEPEIINLLILHGADVNARDQTGMTPLMAAASAKQKKNLHVLLSSGADIDATDNRGFTTLMRAVAQGSPEIVEILLKSRADLNIRTNQGQTALLLANEILGRTRKSLANANQKNSDEWINELRAKLANGEEVFRLLREAGGKE